MQALAQHPNQFATVWKASWLRPGGYRHPAAGLAGLLSRCGAWVAGRPAPTPARSDYFTRLAELPDLPDDHRALALAIVRHQRQVEAVYRLLAAEA